MAQWGRNITGVTANSSTTKETSNGAPIGTFALVKGADPVSMDSNSHFGNTSPGSRPNVDVAMFGNTTVGAFIANKAVGVFAVNSAMMGTVGGNISIGIVTSGGSGYQANAAVTLTVTNGGTGGVVNAHANSSTNPGRIDSLLISTPGSAYITPPTVAIAAPAAIAIVANTTGIVAATDFIKLTNANTYLQSNDHLYYAVAAGNTVIAGLTANSNYWVSFANSTGIVLSATKGGANVDITDVRVTTPAETGHTFQGDTATGYVDVNTDNPLVSHVGWVLRTEGTGGRAGRIQYETLVAMHSIGVNGTSATGVTGGATVTSNTQNDSFV